MSEELQKQVNQLTMQCKGLDAQLVGTKQFLNEQLASILQLRASLVMFQNANQEHMQNEANLNTVIKNLTAENESLLARCTELDAKLNPPASVVPPVIPDNGQ
jgi:chromosome segregation ATPase